jgi:hypothetical protein
MAIPNGLKQQQTTFPVLSEQKAAAMTAQNDSSNQRRMMHVPRLSHY